MSEDRLEFADGRRLRLHHAAAGRGPNGHPGPDCPTYLLVPRTG
jgi:hypothetical protein